MLWLIHHSWTPCAAEISGKSLKQLHPTNQPTKVCQDVCNVSWCCCWLLRTLLVLAEQDMPYQSHPYWSVHQLPFVDRLWWWWCWRWWLYSVVLYSNGYVKNFLFLVSNICCCFNTFFLVMLAFRIFFFFFFYYLYIANAMTFNLLIVE